MRLFLTWCHKVRLVFYLAAVLSICAVRAYEQSLEPWPEYPPFDRDCAHDEDDRFLPRDLDRCNLVL